MLHDGGVDDHPGAASACSGTSGIRRTATGTSTTSSGYELRTVDGRLVVTDRKSGFCLIDRWGLARGMRGRPRALPRFVGDCAALQPRALQVEEGSSVGYTDRYPAFFHGQDLDLTGAPRGLYVLVQHANPERRLRELDYANNAASALAPRDVAGRPGEPTGRAASFAGARATAACYPLGAK